MKKTLLSSILLVAVTSTQVLAAEASGKDIAFDRKFGNCLACHMIPGGTLSGNIAPPLIAMKSRFPDRAKLRDQIWDATVANPSTIMPPFGKHQVVSEEQLDKIVDFLYTL